MITFRCILGGGLSLQLCKLQVTAGEFFIGKYHWAVALVE